jgi:hypothetical protein
MLGDQANEVVHQRFAAALGQLMLLGQGCHEMLDGHRLARLGRSLGLGNWHFE